MSKFIMLKDKQLMKSDFYASTHSKFVKHLQVRMLAHSSSALANVKLPLNL